MVTRLCPIGCDGEALVAGRCELDRPADFLRRQGDERCALGERAAAPECAADEGRDDMEMPSWSAKPFLKPYMFWLDSQTVSSPLRQSAAVANSSIGLWCSAEVSYCRSSLTGAAANALSSSPTDGSSWFFEASAAATVWTPGLSKVAEGCFAAYRTSRRWAPSRAASSVSPSTSATIWPSWKISAAFIGAMEVPIYPPPSRIFPGTTLPMFSKVRTSITPDTSRVARSSIAAMVPRATALVTSHA